MGHKAVSVTGVALVALAASFAASFALLTLRVALPVAPFAAALALAVGLGLGKLLLALVERQLAARAKAVYRRCDLDA